MSEHRMKVRFIRVNGDISVEAENSDIAQDKAIDYVGQKLANAFPELDIEYEVEEEPTYDKEDLKRYIEENYEEGET